MRNRASLSPSAPRWRGPAEGAVRAVPIALGYLPVAFAYGVLSQKAGLSWWNTVAMSLLVYAGASQLIAVGLVAAGVGPTAIVLTTLVVNLRHMIMASAIAPHLKRWHRHELAAFAYELTDETFAVHSSQLPAGAARRGASFATNATAHAAWLCGTGLGIVAGQSVVDVRALALDYALPALFLALLVLQIRSWREGAIALLTGVLAVVLLQLGLGPWHVIAATAIGATAGIIGERWIKPSSS